MSENNQNPINKRIVIGIPAWNEGANIKLLLIDLLSQESEKFPIYKIVVVSDGSDDSTVSDALSLSSEKLEVIDHKDRQGQGARQNEVLSRNDYDCVVLINADMRITDKKFVEKMVQPIMDQGFDLTSCNLQEGKSLNFFESVLAFGNRLKRSAFSNYLNGNNWYNCRGGARGFSKELAENFRFKGSVSEDLYSYLYCISKGNSFKYVKDTECYYSLPSNLSDHVKQNKRFYGSASMFFDEFGEEFVSQHTKWPLTELVKYSIKLGLTQPLQGLTYFVLSVMCMLVCRFSIKESSSKWSAVTSSKQVRL